MSEYKTLNVEEPIDLIKLSLNETVFIKCRHERTLKGKLHAFDAHLNMILSDVEENFLNEESKVKTRKIPMVYIRGDTIILFSPNLRSIG